MAVREVLTGFFRSVGVDTSNMLFSFSSAHTGATFRSLSEIGDYYPKYDTVIECRDKNMRWFFAIENGVIKSVQPQMVAGSFERILDEINLATSHANEYEENRTVAALASTGNVPVVASMLRNLADVLDQPHCLSFTCNPS